MRFPAEESGVLSKILEKEGETVNEQQVLGLLDDQAKEVEVETPAEEVVTEVPVEEAPAKEVVTEVPEEEIVEEEVQNKASDESSNLNEALVMSNRMEERVPMSRIRKLLQVDSTLLLKIQLCSQHLMKLI